MKDSVTRTVPPELPIWAGNGAAAANAGIRHRTPVNPAAAVSGPRRRDVNTFTVYYRIRHFVSYGGY
ncbi:hypothetical protein GCM10009839_22910 [Catenulispora yoronensis]|uniref:Uncharacterized protein n=1 Tax=Catenulispora yoronensis TaxID=450799 RepID=A0ABP5FEC6_9ACTN